MATEVFAHLTGSNLGFLCGVLWQVTAIRHHTGEHNRHKLWTEAHWITIVEVIELSRETICCV